MVPYAERIAEAAESMEALGILQEAVTDYTAGIWEFIKQVPEADLPIVIACADTIRGVMEAANPQDFEHANTIKKHMVAVTIQSPGGQENERTG